MNTSELKINNDEDFQKLSEITQMQIKLYDLACAYNKLKKEIGQKNKESKDMKMYMKEYYNNVEKFKKRDDYVCSDCNCTVKYHSKIAHNKSKKHILNSTKVD